MQRNWWAAIAVVLAAGFGVAAADPRPSPAIAAEGDGAVPAAREAAPSPPTSASGLPIPRFVSLKSDRVNLRTGPGTDYPTAWVFRRAGLPMEVLSEFETWRQVRDSEGTTGWVVHSLLSGRRTALVAPWDIKSGQTPAQVPVRYSDSEQSRPVAYVEPGVIANLHKCDGRWCQVTVENLRGYLPQKQLWGVYEGESIK